MKIEPSIITFKKGEACEFEMISTLLCATVIHDEM